MEEAERVKGKDIDLLIRQLQEDRTAIKIHLLNKGNEWLTIVIGIGTRKQIPYFQIDYPEGFREAVADMEVWKIRFEFTGRGHIPGAFTTSGGVISNDQIWIRFPEVVERLQRREHFRSEVPPGTKINAIINSIRHEITAINISERGALISVRRVGQRGLVLKPGERLKQLRLVFPSEDEEEVEINIDEVLVKTEERDPSTGRYNYGLHFTSIGKSDQNTLRTLIYRFQRQLLQKKE